MNTVVERCPNCGVEHQPSHVGPCEVCGSELRYWCTRHSRTIGWLEGEECPVCTREAEAKAAPPPPAPRPRVERRPARRPTTPPPARRDRRPAPRVGAGEILPHVATGASLAIRVIHALFVLVRTVFLWAVLGAVAGAGYGYLTGSDLIWIGLFGLTNGALIGLFFGFILALRVLLTRRVPR